MSLCHPGRLWSEMKSYFFIFSSPPLGLGGTIWIQFPSPVYLSINFNISGTNHLQMWSTVQTNVGVENDDDDDLEAQMCRWQWSAHPSYW